MKIKINHHSDFQFHRDCDSRADCEKPAGKSQKSNRPFWQRQVKKDKVRWTKTKVKTGEQRQREVNKDKDSWKRPRQVTKDKNRDSGWAKQNSENSGLFRNFLNAFWLSYPHPHSIGPFLCRKFSLIILCILLFARVHFRISCIYEKDVQKEKVNTGMTRIFRQHKFIAFRYLNVYYKKAKPKLKSL